MWGYRNVEVTAVTSLKCYTCFITHGQCRNEDMTLVECEADETYCISLTLRTTFSIPSVSYTTKTCAKPEEANDGYYSITSVGAKYFEALLYSCQLDGCNSLPSSLPYREELKPNRLICPGSYARDEYSPQLPQPVLCLGRENWCGNIDFGMYTIGAIHDEIFAQGCVTKNVCSYPLGETQMGNGIVKFNVTSNNCSIALQLPDVFYHIVFEN
ncbi:phospholipase A2 inhibitor and Ly6/PLAUR domain-containing protein-like [Pituophis catenifer annectens]|uniref:phospholipase A2 inhibitor and Ly6/PLAUR domain-containing protein-like n=1 Tax=Pituophis catenifer annectens TaxID=94852 RepID=UPI003996365F